MPHIRPHIRQCVVYVCICMYSDYDVRPQHQLLWFHHCHIALHICSIEFHKRLYRVTVVVQVKESKHPLNNDFSGHLSFKPSLVSLYKYTLMLYYSVSAGQTVLR